MSTSTWVTGTPMSQRGTIAALVLGSAAVVLDVGGASAVLRLPVTLLFLLVGPGIVLVPLLRLPDALSNAVLVVAGSISLDVLASQALLYTVGFTWQLALITLDCLVVGCAAARILPSLVRDSRRRPRIPVGGAARLQRRHRGRGAP